MQRVVGRLGEEARSRGEPESAGARCGFAERDDQPAIGRSGQLPLDLLLEDRGYGGFEHRERASDAKAGHPPVQLADGPLWGIEPVQRVVGSQEIRSRVQRPRRSRPVRLDQGPTAVRRQPCGGRALRGPGRPPPRTVALLAHGRVSEPPPERP